MARQCKCKYCNEYINKEDLVTKIEKINNGKTKKINLHNNCENDYNELMEYKSNEIKWFDELYICVKEILGYSEEQVLPNYLVIRLQDLRNGTVMKRGIGRVVKSKEGYKYEIILDTFLTQAERIDWSFKNKTFENEKNKINYMMAIIENNINDSYMSFKGRDKANIIKERNNLLEEEKIIQKQKNNTNIIIRKESSGISKFLEDDDF